jgi:LPXTG-motif cell wall-anchored protein
MGALPKLGSLAQGSPLPLPTVPGLPPVPDPAPESGHAGGPGTQLRLTLGTVHQATEGTAIAARATAMNVTVTKNPARGGSGYGGEQPAGVVLDLNVGLLEAAAVAPPTAGATAGAVSGAVSGAGGGLPITGPATGALAVFGGVLVALGAGALIFTRRRRPQG